MANSKLRNDPQSEQLREKFKQFGRRIRERREKEGMTAISLSKALGVTPAYIYLIETSRRFPREDKARDLAKILKEDPELYAAWSQAGRGKMGALHDAAEKLDEMFRAQGVDVGVATGNDVRFTRRRLATEQSKPEMEATDDSRPSAFLEVPIIPEGSLPESRPAEWGNYVEIQPDVLPPGEEATSPYAYRVTVEGARRAGKLLQVGDTVIISREVGPPRRTEIYAVRAGEKVVLSRVMVRPRVLILLSDEGEEGIDGIPIEGPEDIHHVLIGRVVAVIRQQVLHP